MSTDWKTIRISVRNLVEFVMRSGDIDNRRTSSAEKDAMQAGSRMHRKIQKRQGASYHAEVAMKHIMEQEDYRILVEGRADGVIEEASGVTIDEIKCVYMDLHLLEEAAQVHLAQAFCYAHMYCCDHESLNSVTVQITYCNLETEEIRRFRQDKSREELTEWFEGLIHEYVKWAEYLYRHTVRRNESLRDLEFPYEYRPGQKELAVSVYRALARKRNLFIQAPTGIGKTLSVVYPALKSMGSGNGEKLFYLTAKTITRSVAENCFSLLRGQGMCFTTVTITAKEKLCPLEKAECNPDACPYAKGHFDRVNDAVYDIIHEQQGITRDIILEYAKNYRVCPFEFCLDISSWADGIICDYNYVFDPNAKLKRYFADGNQGDYLFLVDEAHNLVNRARGMYSACLVKEDILQVKRIIKGKAPRLERALERCNRNLLEWKRESAGYRILPEANLLVSNLLTVMGEFEPFLDEHREFSEREIVLQFYFGLRHFLNMYDGLDDHYRIYTELGTDGKFCLYLFCIDPSRCLNACLKQGVAGIFFSATMIPVMYYKRLLSGNTEDFAIYANSPFDSRKRQILIAKDVSSRYTRRNRAEFGKVADYITKLAHSHTGNYMVFFPSYSYMEAVKRILDEHYDGTFRWQMQTNHMTEEEREGFLEQFEGKKQESFVGLCVLGGIFSEGIDLKAERLEGTIIVGTGLPMVCSEQEILMQYFDDHGKNGYDYAYQYPGMNKVLQAAGRVIRTAEDRGVILLLDDRFLRREIQELFPREWTEYGLVTRETVDGWLRNFWEKVKKGDATASP